MSSMPCIKILFKDKLILYTIDDKIDILCAASVPLISKVGSASAYPRSLAEVNASSKDISLVVI